MNRARIFPLRVLLTVPRWYFFCGSFVCLSMLSRLFIAALWSPARKGMTPWLFFFVMFNCEFVTFPRCILGQVLDCIDDICPRSVA